MSLKEAKIISKAGWHTEDEHALYLAALDIVYNEVIKIRKKLLADYYSNPGNDRRKEDRREHD